MSDTAGTGEARSGPGRVQLLQSPVLFAVVALMLFACIAVAVSLYPRTSIDDGIRGWVVAARRPAGVAFFAFVSTVGSVTPMLVYAAVVTVGVALVRHSMVPLTVLFAPAVAVFAYLGTKSIVLRARPSGVGNAFEGTYSFPSAHATTSSAVSFAVAYLLVREGMLPGGAAFVGAALVTAVIGISRVYLDVHWATDVAGGWCLGVAIAATASALYESAGGPVGRAMKRLP